MMEFFNQGEFGVAKARSLGGELVVGPSLPMSSFCYSIFRLDPYIGCSHSCVYCYTRFLPGFSHGSLSARIDYPKLFRKAIEKWRKAGVAVPPFRMSALTDPFQPIERKSMLSLSLLRLSLTERVPLIINTKSTLVGESPWLDVIKELSGEGLAIVQFSIAFLEDNVSKVIEPGAPPPSKRLDVAEKLSSEGIPVVLRFQPIVPFLNSGDEYVEKYAEEAKKVNAKHVIAEVLRVLSWKELEVYRKVMNEDNFRKLVDKSNWERFLLGSHKHPKREIRQRIYNEIKASIEKMGLTFATCREGLYQMWSAPDCCGIFLLKNKILRYTLYEHFYGEKQGYTYLRPDDYSKIPIPEVRRKLQAHDALLKRIIQNRELLSTIVS